MVAALRLLHALSLLAATYPGAAVPVWPLPQRWTTTGGPSPSGMRQGAPFEVALSGAGAGSGVATAAVERYTPRLRVATHRQAPSRLALTVRSANEALGQRTDYSYGLSWQGQATHGVANGSAASPYGVAYALESLLQLLESGWATAPFALEDWPTFPHRGLLVDAGRRFHPPSLLRTLMDGMAAVKLNVLHLYLSEECFRVESRLYPGLTRANCTVEPNYHFADPGYCELPLDACQPLLHVSCCSLPSCLMHTWLQTRRRTLRSWCTTRSCAASDSCRRSTCRPTQPACAQA